MQPTFALQVGIKEAKQRLGILENCYKAIHIRMVDKYLLNGTGILLR